MMGAGRSSVTTRIGEDPKAPLSLILINRALSHVTTTRQFISVEHSSHADERLKRERAGQSRHYTREPTIVQVFVTPSIRM